MACLVLFLWQGVQAGNLAVNPIRLDLSVSSQNAALTLRNQGTEPMLLQLELVEWAMDNGQDLYAPTDDLLATPPIFTIQPGQSQIVRVGLRRPLGGRQERTYRLFLQEPPVQRRSSSQQLQGLRVALRIGIPVFVAPVVPAQVDLKWRAIRSDDGPSGSRQLTPAMSTRG